MATHQGTAGGWSVSGGGLTARVRVECGRVAGVELARAGGEPVWADGAWGFLLEAECDGMLYCAGEAQLLSVRRDGPGGWRALLRPRFEPQGGPDCKIEWRWRGVDEGIEESLALRNGDRPLRIRALRTMLTRASAEEGWRYWPIPFPPRGSELAPVDLAAAASFEGSRDGAVLLAAGGGMIVARRPMPFDQEPLFVGVR